MKNDFPGKNCTKINCLVKQYTPVVRVHRSSSFREQGFAILNDSTLSIENFIRRLLRCINVISFAVTRLDPEFHSDINDIFGGNAGEGLVYVKTIVLKVILLRKNTRTNILCIV